MRRATFGALARMGNAPKDLQRRALITGSGALAVAGCANSIRTPQPSAFGPSPRILPIDLSPNRLTNITVCARPFRAAGPRIEEEQVGDKSVVHAYGHGGAGWSLSWGTADIVLQMVRPKSPKSVAVIGGGAIGTAVATVLQREGIPTTVYAKEFRGETPSARATGTWSPQSRIAKTSDVPSGFAEQWETMARHSYAVHQQFVGLHGNPVEYTPRYYLPSGGSSGSPDDGFFKPGGLRDIIPDGYFMPPGSHPFHFDGRVRTFLTMTFNITEYLNRIWTEFLLMGGKTIRRDFSSPTEIAALGESVVVNCTGYGAKMLWNDDSLVPYRGQIAWLAPQPDRLYGLYYKDVTVLSRRDGVVVQYRGPSERYGMGSDDLTPDRNEFLDALAAVQPVFARGR